MVQLNKLYSAFLTLIEDDEWDAWEEWEREQDWKQLVFAASAWFKFPRVSLDIDYEKSQFENEKVGNAEIQVLAQYMKAVWLGRVIDSVDNLRPLYQERDFSPAQMLSEFQKKQESQLKIAKELESRYYRSVNGRPYDYSQLGGR